MSLRHNRAKQKYQQAMASVQVGQVFEFDGQKYMKTSETNSQPLYYNSWWSNQQMATQLVIAQSPERPPRPRRQPVAIHHEPPKENGVKVSEVKRERMCHACRTKENVNRTCSNPQCGSTYCDACTNDAGGKCLVCSKMIGG